MEICSKNVTNDFEYENPRDELSATRENREEKKKCIFLRKKLPKNHKKIKKSYNK